MSPRWVGKGPQAVYFWEQLHLRGYQQGLALTGPAGTHKIASYRESNCGTVYGWVWAKAGHSMLEFWRTMTAVRTGRLIHALQWQSGSLYDWQAEPLWPCGRADVVLRDLRECEVYILDYSGEVEVSNCSACKLFFGTTPKSTARQSSAL